MRIIKEGLQGERWAVNENIIKEHCHEFVKEGLQEVIHGGLERGGGIVEPKWHDFEFIMVLMRAKHSLRDISFCHSYLMESLTQIQFGEPESTTKFIKQFIDSWHWKMVFDGNRVKCPVIDLTPPTVVFLFNQ